MAESQRTFEKRLAWHKQAATNLRTYLAELEEYLARIRPGNQGSVTEQLIVEVKRRLALLDEELPEER